MTNVELHATKSIGLLQFQVTHSAREKRSLIRRPSVEVPTMNGIAQNLIPTSSRRSRVYTSQIFGSLILSVVTHAVQGLAMDLVVHIHQ